MTKITIAQLPALQQLKTALDLQERIHYHQEQADRCLDIFNQYTVQGFASQAATFQERCEWHFNQVCQLRIELNLIQRSMNKRKGPGS